MSGVPVRPTARALVLDERDRILLFRFRDPGRTSDHLAAPGGRIEDGETAEEAARREIAEELELDDVTLGPPIWDRVSEFDFLGTWTRVLERFFVVRIRADDVPAYEGHLADENVVEREWWTLDDLELADETVWPSELVVLTRRLLREGPPPEPLPIGP